MPDMTAKQRGCGRRFQPDSQSYDTPRWKDIGPLIPGPSKKFVRKATERASGRTAILKHESGGQMRRRRFYDEALNMYRMSSTPGILPVWDIDETRPTKPRWYAMPRAQLLNDALGEDATLRDIVRHIAFLADVLARLADHGTYHRDVKPANLFWWEGHPVLADFGIAAWGTDSSQAWRGSLTRAGEKLGPANFIAPEMRHNRPSDRGRRADVYSLAKTLFVLALPGRGPYPPDGIHRADSEEFSLWETGGGPGALTALRHVLEAATEFDSRRRLSMAEFRDELRAWLDRYPEEQFRRRGERPRYMFGWESFLGRSERNRRDREETESMMLTCISKIAQVLTGDPEAPIQQSDDGGGEVFGDYAWEPNTEEDGFMPDNGTIWMATYADDGRRIILEAVLDTYVCFLAESHAEGSPWRLEWQWGPTAWARPRMPRTAEMLEKLADDVVAWITKTTCGS